MALREVALCDGKYIGIETIYTVINGKQINIPDKLADLRQKGRENKLFCPCGCGTNLIVVAGDKNIREQHFREKFGTSNPLCTLPTEGRSSLVSKIVLKCWLDDKLRANDIESRVPIGAVDNTGRRPEFTFLSKDKHIAIRYWMTGANIVNDRLDVLSGNVSGIDVFYIADMSNDSANGQYPEKLMKLQERQGYCLLLDIRDGRYENAVMVASFYRKDIDGLWQKVVIAEDNINQIEIVENKLFFKGENVTDLLSSAIEKFDADQQAERENRQAAAKRYAEQLEKERIEFEKKLAEAERIKQEKEKQRLAMEAQKRAEAEAAKAKKQKAEVDFVRNIKANFSQQETIVRDAEGNRWVKCEFCGKIAKESEFSSYGGPNHINLGICYDCAANNPAVKEAIEQQVSQTKEKSSQRRCPVCGGELKKRNGRYGTFWGCSNYPRCRFTE